MLPTQAAQKPGYVVITMAAETLSGPSRSPQRSEFIPTFPGHGQLLLRPLSRNHQGHPTDYTAGSWPVRDSSMNIHHQWIFNSQRRRASWGPSQLTRSTSFHACWAPAKCQVENTYRGAADSTARVSWALLPFLASWGLPDKRVWLFQASASSSRKQT